MPLVRRRHATLVVLFPLIALPCGAQRASPVAAVPPVAARRVVSGDAVPTSHRARNAKRGAVIGGVLGAIAGAAGSTQMGVGCAIPADGNSRDTTRTRLHLALWFGGLGLVGVGAVGALLGALIP